MNDRTSIVVLADDLTGAAEIAAAGFARGLASVVATGSTQAHAEGELVVHDTDTRLLQPAEAARRIVAIGARCRIAEAAQHGTLVFKKTDSVLRGPVVAELDTLSAITRHSRVLLVAGNPRLGRRIVGGHFLIGGEPITRSVFGRDPHHPARSSEVTELLGPPRRGTIQVIRPGDPMPESGIIVGEASSMEDVAHWARCVTPDTLPAGSSVFFEAILESRGLAHRDAVAKGFKGGGRLIVSGTTAETTRTALGAQAAELVPVFTMPEACARSAGPEAASVAHQWSAALLGALAQRGCAAALAPSPVISDPGASARIRSAFATLIAELHDVHAFQDLVIEGGATAAVIMHRLHWNVLETVGEFAPGVATLRPQQEGSIRVTLKPGSYPWPSDFFDELSRARPASP